MVAFMWYIQSFLFLSIWAWFSSGWWSGQQQECLRLRRTVEKFWLFPDLLSILCSYDESIDKWTIVTFMPSPRVCMQLVSVSGRLYFAGGFDEMVHLVSSNTLENSSCTTVATNRGSRKLWSVIRVLEEDGDWFVVLFSFVCSQFQIRLVSTEIVVALLW